MSSVEKQITKDNITDEIINNETIIQTNLKKAENKFVDDEILSADIIEAEYELIDTIIYNGERYRNITQNENCHAYISEGNTVYLPVFLLDYQGSKQIFSSGFYDKKDKAKKEIQSLKKYYDNNNFRFKIESDYTILHSQKENKLFEKLKQLDLFKITNVDSFMLFAVPLLIMLILSLILILAFQPENSPHIKYGLIYFVSFIPIIIKFSLMKVDNTFKIYKILNINEDYIDNMFDKTLDYKTVDADINIDESGLELYSEELDCKWVYERKDNNLLPEKGIELLQKLPTTDNKCVITVKKEGMESDELVSSDGEWFIDEESTF